LVKNLLVPDDIGGIGTVTSWFKKEGDKFQKGEMILELETRKAIVQVDAPEPGMIVRIKAKAGDAVVSRSLLALYVLEGEEVPSELSKPPPPVRLVIRLLDEGKLVTNAKVTIDGRELVLTSEREFALDGLEPGKCIVNVKAPGFLEKVFVFSLEEDSKHDLELVSIQKFTGKAPGTGQKNP